MIGLHLRCIIRTDNPALRGSLFPERLQSRPRRADRTDLLSPPRAGNDKPRGLDFAVLDDFLALKREGALPSAQFSAESLHTDLAATTDVIVSMDLEGPSRSFAIDVSSERFARLISAKAG